MPSLELSTDDLQVRKTGIMVDVQYADEEMREALPQRNNARKTKGRGFQDRDADVEDDRGGRYDTHGMDSRGPVKCESCFAASYKLLSNLLVQG